MAQQFIALFPMVEYSESKKAIADSTNTELLPANTARKAGSYIQNNTTATIWLSHTGTASLNNGIALYRGGTYQFNTRQSLHAYQESGDLITLHIVEAI